ncbi:TRAP transporter small permease [Phaeobacter sp. 22II1-1F12B]|uniref:TRAP transporter small permease n=1 Tax=Phaeobacter sp. 22II1-1F12B TaxID=1317111 RepID=UPI000B528848|nr:TRAP transporter small permease [Phaeobacter sp. 22II1-1F12B]
MTPDWITSLVRGADRALIAIASLGLMAMMLHICLDIGASLLLNAPIATTSAIVTNYYMIAVAFLPIYTAEVRNGHIGVNLVTAMLPPRIQNGLDLLMLTLTAGVYALLTAQSWGQAMKKFVVNDFVVEQTTKIFLWPSYFMLPVTFAAVTLLMLVKVALRLTYRMGPGEEFLPGREGQDHV